MNIYQVVVDCWYQVHDQRRRLRRTIEVEADLAHAACDVARDYCDATADGSRNWIGFEVVATYKASRIAYPREIKREERP